jgi:hypothetical protein
MVARMIKIIVPVVALLTIVVLVYLARPKPASVPAPVPQLACTPPPSPFFASTANVEVALTESIKVLKAQASPSVLDVIPKDARGLEMIGFLTCRAREQGLIKSAPELNEYTELLGRLQSGRPVEPFVRHFGSLASLEKHLRTAPADNFSLLLSDTRGLLPRFEIDELAARDWQSWFKKFCSRYTGCLTCSPEGDALRESVTVSATEALKEVTLNDKKVVACTP